MGIWCQNDVVLTSMRRDDVASTSIQRHFDTKCPLGGHDVQSVTLIQTLSLLSFILTIVIVD